VNTGVSIYRRIGVFSLLIGMLVIGSHHRLQAAETVGLPDQRYEVFWSRLDNVFLFRPSLIRDVFYGVFELKGNPKLARHFIEREVLGCSTASSINGVCRIDRLQQLRRKLNLSETFSVPVNFSSVTIRPHPADIKRQIVTLQWKPALFQPPISTLSDFCQYLGIAENSPYYQVRTHLERIQINPLFQNQIEITIGRSSAENLRQLYLHPPVDFEDQITFSIGDIRRETTADMIVFTLELKSTRVKINHITYPVSQVRLL